MGKPQRTRVSARTFLAAVTHDTEWAWKIGGEIEVLEPLTGVFAPPRKILVIPDNVLVTGIDKDGLSMDISGSPMRGLHACLSGALNARNSKLQSTRGLRVLGMDKDGVAADFAWSINLTTAEGIYAGAVSFGDCGSKSSGTGKAGGGREKPTQTRASKDTKRTF